jgi:glutathione peroxidase
MTATTLTVLTIAFAFAALSAGVVGAKPKSDQKTPFDSKRVPDALNFTVNSLDGKPVNLSKYQGKVVLMVNTASKCGYTPQYKSLQALHEKYKDKGLAILGFPSNDFGQQEPGTDEEIATFCEKNYGVTFDMFSKVVVKGDKQCPLYKHLTSTDTNPKHAGEIKWNFEKFLINRKGEIVNRFNSKVTPDSDEMIKAIEAELAAK